MLRPDIPIGTEEWACHTRQLEGAVRGRDLPAAADLEESNQSRAIGLARPQRAAEFDYRQRLRAPGGLIAAMREKSQLAPGTKLRSETPGSGLLYAGRRLPGGRFGSQSGRKHRNPGCP